MNRPPLPTGNVGAGEVSAERIRWTIRNRFSPLRGITPAGLTGQLDEWRSGGHRIAHLWESIRLRDDLLCSVAGKRLDAVARLRWEILIDEDRADGHTAEAQRHQEVLQGFYSNLDVTEALNQDHSGGVGLLARTLALAKFDRFSVLEWLWRPAGGRRSATTAQFVACPLWWFESRTGRLQFLSTDWAYDGQPMDPAGWLVASAPHWLMEAACVAWMYKLLPLRDWLAFSEKFGMPGLHAKTSAPKDSDEWTALKEAVAAFGQDWALVTNDGASIEPIQAGGAAGNLPYPPLVEMLNRSLAALVRGADLSTMSAQSGAGQGASLQGEESDLMEEDDARLVSETCQRRVDTRVLQYHFGPDVTPLAYFKLVPCTRQDLDQDVKVDEFLLRNRIELGKEDLRSRYNRPAPREGEEAVQAPAAPNSDLRTPNSAPRSPNSAPLAVQPAEFGNSAADLAELAAAIAEDLAPVRDRLAKIAELTDPDSQRLALRGLLAELPELTQGLLRDPAAAAAWQQVLGRSLAEGLRSEANLEGMKA